MTEDVLKQRLIVLENIVGNMMRILAEIDGDLTEPLSELEKAWGDALRKIAEENPTQRIVVPENK